MSCSHDEGEGPLSVERETELPGTPEEVWDELPDVIDDGSRVRVDDECEPGRRWTFFWTPAEGDDAPSYVEIELDASGDGTLIRIRETRLDGAELSRAVLNARALV